MSVAARRGGTFRSLQVRNFRLLFLGQGASQIGTWTQTIAQGWLVLRLSDNSGVVLGLVTAIQFLPTLFFGAWAGVLADRFDKRRILVSAQIAMGISALLLGIADVTGTATVWNVCALVCISGVALAVESPARQSIISDIVRREDVPNAIALTGLLINSARLIGPALAGLVILTVGTGACFLLNAFSYVIVTMSILMMRSDEMSDCTLVERSPGQVRDGLRYVYRERDMRAVLVLSLLAGTFGFNFNVVFPLLAKVTFQGDAGTYSAMTAAMGIGAVAAVFLLARRRQVDQRDVLFTTAAFGGMLCLAAAAPSLDAMFPLLVLVGSGWVAFASTGNSFVQLHAEPAMRGRVIAIRLITLNGTTPIGAPIVGWICGELGPRWGLAFGGLATLGGCAYYAVAQLDHIRRPSPGGDASTSVMETEVPIDPSEPV